MKLYKILMTTGLFMWGGISLPSHAVISPAAFDLGNCVVSGSTAGAAVADDCIGNLTTGTGAVNPSETDLNNPLARATSYPSLSGHVQSQINNTPWNPGAFAYNDWMEAARYNKGDSGPAAMGLNVTGSGAVRNWSVTTPMNGMWILLVKQSRQSVLYLFDSLAGVTGGTVNLSGFINSNDYSHVTLFKRDSKPGNEIPLPNSLYLLALGAAIMFARRRRLSKS